MITVLWQWLASDAKVLFGKTEQRHNFVCNVPRKVVQQKFSWSVHKKKKISLASNKAAILQLTDPILCESRFWPDPQTVALKRTPLFHFGILHFLDFVFVLSFDININFQKINFEKP